MNSDNAEVDCKAFIEAHRACMLGCVFPSFATLRPWRHPRSDQKSDADPLLPPFLVLQLRLQGLE